MTLDLPTIRAHSIALLNDPRTVRIEGMQQRFNVFAAMQWTRQELKHSAFLRWLMDPSESHGMGTAFLSRLVLLIARRNRDPSQPSVDEVMQWTAARAVVLREWNRIDLLVRDDFEGFALVIENKVDTGEHDDQLQRYRQRVDEELSGHRTLYGFLSPSGLAASDQAYVALSYADIADLIEEVLEDSTVGRDADAEVFVRQYLDMLRRYILEDSEVSKLCREIYRDHREVLDLLFEHRPDRGSELREHLLAILGSVSELIADANERESWVRFIPERLDEMPKIGTSWSSEGSSRLILFQVSLGGSEVKIKLTLGSSKDQAARELAVQHIRGLGSTFNLSDSEVGPRYWDFHEETLVDSKQYESLPLQDLLDLVDSSFERFRTERMPGLVAALVPLNSRLRHPA